MDDFYFNILDWGINNVLGLALDCTVQLWDASYGSPSELVTVDEELNPVTSVSWAPDGCQIAVGLNNSEVQFYEYCKAATDAESSNPRPTQYLHRLEDHTSAVKALAWCPFQRNLLATGGGGEDKTIKFWNSQTGACLNSVDTGSQVCALLRNKHEKELLCSHGFSGNQLTLWKYPSMVKIAELTGRTSRVLFMAQSPDGCTVASAAGDENLMVWYVFGDPATKKSARKANPEPFSWTNRCTIR